MVLRDGVYQARALHAAFEDIFHLLPTRGSAEIEVVPDDIAVERPPAIDADASGVREEGVDRLILLAPVDAEGSDSWDGDRAAARVRVLSDRAFEDGLSTTVDGV